MVPREIALLNLVRSLDDDVESGQYERPRIVFLASRMSDQDVAGMAVHSQQEMIVDVARAELFARGLDVDGDTIDPIQESPPADPDPEPPRYSLTEEDLNELVF